MTSPDFIIVGASRAGTTTLHALLSQSPYIYMPPEKELQFFWRDNLYNAGLKYYEKFFKASGEDQVKGEASPPYFHKNVLLGEDNQYLWNEDEDPAQRIARTYPNAKIIITLRDPASRAHSQYLKNHWQGRETCNTFEEALALEMDGARNPENNGFCWLYYNHYATHVQNWLNLFPRDQVFILIFEEWVKDPIPTLHKIENFIGAKHYTDYDTNLSREKNAGRVLRHKRLAWLANLNINIPAIRWLGRVIATKPERPTMAPETRKKLANEFRSDKKYLENLLGREISTWSFEYD